MIGRRRGRIGSTRDPLVTPWFGLFALRTRSPAPRAKADLARGFVGGRPWLEGPAGCRPGVLTGWTCKPPGTEFSRGSSEGPVEPTWTASVLWFSTRYFTGP